jgi:hypothetical protein
MCGATQPHNMAQKTQHIELNQTKQEQTENRSSTR